MAEICQLDSQIAQLVTNLMDLQVVRQFASTEQCYVSFFISTLVIRSCLQKQQAPIIARKEDQWADW